MWVQRGTASASSTSTRSNSSAVVNRLKENLTVLFASSAGSPIARRTLLGSTLPDEHAEPVDTATPFRSIAITSPSASTLRNVALVVFGSWRPGKALLGALLFAFFDALQLRLQQSSGGLLPYQVYLMIPFVLSILALIVVSRKAAYPQALMKPYRKGER